MRNHFEEAGGFRRNAAECRSNAQKAKSEQIRTELVRTAEIWEQLAVDREFIAKLRKNPSAAKRKRSPVKADWDIRSPARQAPRTGPGHGEPDVLQRDSLTGLAAISQPSQLTQDTCGEPPLYPELGSQTLAVAVEKRQVKYPSASTRARRRRHRNRTEILFAMVVMGVVSSLEVIFIVMFELGNHA